MRFSHRELDPRSKLAFVVPLFLLGAVANRIAGLLALGTLVAVFVVAGRDLGLREWIGALSPFKYLIPVILALNSVFYGGGDVLAALPLGPFRVSVTVGGILTSILIALRLLVLAAAATWFGLTTDATEFERGLTLVGVPWRLAFVGSLTLRLVPEMRGRFRNIEDAQRARGLEISGGPIARARARLPMLVPFLASIVQYGYELSDALAARDFERSEARTSLIELGYGPADYALFAATMGLFGVFAAVVVGTV
ncbi:MAG: energy-coupling factor transporter transmembrane component T [Halanaeroarchaeum sp.]